jgi:hypothetical protein
MEVDLYIHKFLISTVVGSEWPAPAAHYSVKVLLLSVGHTEQGRPSGNAPVLYSDGIEFGSGSVHGIV